MWIPAREPDVDSVGQTRVFVTTVLGVLTDGLGRRLEGICDPYQLVGLK